MKLHPEPSGGCNPFNWLNQTSRNLTTKYLNFNFVITPKLTPLHSFFAEKVFVSCVCPIRVSLVPTTSKSFRYQYFAAYPFRFKHFHQIVNRRYFQLVAKEVVEGLGTGSLVTVASLAPDSCGCEEIL